MLGNTAKPACSIIIKNILVAMFHWATAQTLPEKLLELLNRSGASRRPWVRRESGAVVVYMAPHQLLWEGSVPLEAVRISYALTLAAATTEQCVAIHGERLLQCSQEMLAKWGPGQPLPAGAPLHEIPPLESALTAAVLRSVPEFADTYQQLELLCQRGSSAADDQYASRLESSQAEALVQAWNRHQNQLAATPQQVDRDHWVVLQQQHELRNLQRSQQVALSLLQRSTNLVSRLLHG